MSEHGQDFTHTSHTFAIPLAEQPWSYAYLELATDGPQPITLDNLMVKSYMTAALTQFLGLTGSAIPIDILKAQDSICWVRLPREDMDSFAAAITAYRGSREADTQFVLRMKGSSNWLGLLLGQVAQEEVFRRVEEKSAAAKD
ncbi:hypothetical protein E4U17_002032 [Claviceps sp. LM77 group G4]|nr:hypothetical protein E4U17_002032 [Claviceps sp. LM77 group G4]KAG6080672.1 hypothetical protein E4U16_000101 [Claviceps sp. LM84 group G4]KAG6086230.1 hypothetical protein E4U33_007344 [Claviceps sp. LM78 group G4]